MEHKTREVKNDKMIERGEKKREERYNKYSK